MWKVCIAVGYQSRKIYMVSTSLFPDNNIHSYLCPVIVCVWGQSAHYMLHFPVNAPFAAGRPINYYDNKYHIIVDILFM